ncbi:sensor histidine kinase [Hymenobacter edaphi]|uniref:sensor histidine kinase n=1 Tax=Hymenobacter edaphi TaxID=2211146 RepID=UPI0010576F32|nr:histidine kinase [Hymenobacter edaphi]
MLLALRAAAAPAPGGWQPDAALSKLMLRTLVTTPEGLMWVGTDDGVYRYDGTELVPLNALRRAGPALPPVPCNQLLPLPDGSLWVGTESGLYRFGPDGGLRALPLPAPDQPSRYIAGVQLAADGRHVWVYQREVGLRRYSPQGRPAGPLLPYTAEVTDWFAAPDGTHWMVSETHTSQLDSTGRLRRNWYPNPAEPLFPVYDPRGRIWLLSRHAAYRLDARNQLHEALRWAPTSQQSASDLLRNTPTGPVLLRPGQLLQLSWTAGPAPQPRLLFSLALPDWSTGAWNGRLRADNAGRWWVFDSGTRGCWFRTAAPAFIQPLPGPDGQPYSVRASVRLPDGRLLVSSYQKGLLTQAPDSPLAPLRRWPAAALPAGNAPVLMGVVPAPLGPGGDWLAVGVFPFLHFNPHSGRINKLPVTDQSANNAGILSLARDPASGRVWGGTRAGLYWYDAAAATYRPFTPAGAPAPLAGRSIEDVCPDGRGHLWLATPEGVERLTLATGSRTSYGPGAPAGRRAPVDGARCLYLAPDGRLWVGTRAHGLAVIEPDGRAHPALTLGQGLPNASVATITPSPGGYLWLGTYQGLVRYHPGSGRLAIFTTAHGLASDECNARAAYIDPADGSLLIGGVAGLHRIWPDRAPAPAAARPHLLLTRLTTFGTAANHTRYLLPPDARPALHLAPDAPLVDLHLALTHDADPARARYAYRVRGWLGNRWLGLGTTPQLRLQGLPPGRYTVDIRAETSQGVPATNQLSLPLTVTAAWWNRPLTWVLAGLAAVAAVYLWQRGRLLRLRRENELRARLAADLHDEVGALLTRVTMQAELLRELELAPTPQLEALVDDSRAAASTVRDIIWSVDAGADTLAALVDRVQDHLDATARATGRALSLDDTALPPTLDRPLPPAVRQHVYLVFKEALTNALKYSQPGTSIAVGLSGGAQLELTVSSQGAPAATSRAGQGLRNMRHRAALLRAALEAGPAPGGWRVRLRVPL